MRIPLDRNSRVPLYRQIQRLLRAQIQSGTLLPETRLPATRELAQQGAGADRLVARRFDDAAPSVDFCPGDVLVIGLVGLGRRRPLFCLSRLELGLAFGGRRVSLNRAAGRLCSSRHAGPSRRL